MTPQLMPWGLTADQSAILVVIAIVFIAGLFVMRIVFNVGQMIMRCGCAMILLIIFGIAFLIFVHNMLTPVG